MINVYESQWWSPNKIRAWQMVTFRGLIDFVKRNGPPFYKDFLDKNNLHSHSFHVYEDLGKLPIIGKEEMRIVISQVDPAKFKNSVASGTGGSTGESLKYYASPGVYEIGYACRNRGFRWAGCRFGVDRMVFLAGGSLVQKGVSIEGNVLKLPAVDITSDEVYEEYYRRIVEFGALYMRTYPSCAYMFCQFLNHSGKRLRFNSVVTTAEQMFPHQRSLIEKTLGCKIFDEYGAYDGGAGAFECEKGNMHLQSERGIVEIVDEDGRLCKDGELGRIITTDLWNFVNPFIRYDVGDMAVPTNRICECGRGLPLIKSLEGRTLDFIVSDDGHLFSGGSVFHLFNRLIQGGRKIKQFQVVQENEKDLKLKIVKEEGYTACDSNSILRAFKERFPGMNIYIEFNDIIKPSPSGKRRVVINEMKCGGV